MAYKVTIFPKQRLGVVRLSGHINGWSILEAMDTLYTSDTWEPGFNTVWDGLRISELTASPEDTARILERTMQLASQAGDGRTALVTRRDVHSMFAQMIVSRGTHPKREQRVFTSFAGALQWLNKAEVPSPTVKRAALRRSLMG